MEFTTFKMSPEGKSSPPGYQRDIFENFDSAQFDNAQDYVPFMYQLQNMESYPPATFVSHQPSYPSFADFQIQKEQNNSGSQESTSGAIIQNANTSDCQAQSPKSNNFSPSCSSTSNSTGERRRRIVFSLHQLHVLQQTFDEHVYISQKNRQELAKELGLTEVQVKCWFQNRRMKVKRQYVTKPPQRPPSSSLSSQSMNDVGLESTSPDYFQTHQMADLGYGYYNVPPFASPFAVDSPFLPPIPRHFWDLSTSQPTSAMQMRDMAKMHQVLAPCNCAHRYVDYLQCPAGVNVAPSEAFPTADCWSTADFAASLAPIHLQL
uniref:homeobox protein VENTX-like isoform X2 n=1 Tax=Myxine glutinosa TaxID=7769 RepID=UPI00358E6830